MTGGGEPMDHLSAMAAHLWGLLGETPAGRCSAYTPAFLRLERLGDLLTFLAYMAFPVRALMAGRRMAAVPFPSLLVVTALFIIACGTTHLLKVLTGYHPGLLPLSLASTLGTAAISWAAVVAIEGAWRAVRDKLNGSGGVAAHGAARATRAYLVLLLVVLSLGTIGVASYRTFAGFLGSLEAREADREAARTAERLNGLIRAAESGQRGYLITRDTAYLVPYESARHDVAPTLEALVSSPACPPEMAGGLRDDVLAKMAELSHTVELARVGRAEDALRVLRDGSGRTLMKSIQARTDRVIREIDGRLLARERPLGRSANMLMVATPAAYTLAPLAVLWSMALVRRAARRQSAAETLARVAAEIGSANTRAAVAEKQAAQREAAQREAEADAARAESGRNADLLNALSHDMRTPLNGIAQIAQLGEVVSGIRPVDPDRVADGFRQVRRKTMAMKDLLEQFLETSRAERGRPEPVSFAVGPLLRDVAETVQPEAAAKGLQLSVDCADGLIGRTDRRFVNRIALNLLSNAVKYTERGSVTVSARPAPGGFRIDVADTGIGIPPDKLGILFHDFQQLDNHARDARKGFGLGLSLVRRMADSLGGRVSVASELGTGSTFTVVLPDLIDQ